MLSVYVFTAGATTREVFNAVSAFMQTGAFSKAMSIAVMFSIISCAIQYVQTHDLMNLLKWFSVYFFVSFLLVGVKTDVQIIDLTTPMIPYSVDNVPYGIAMPASIITSLEAGLTEGIEDVFHTPNDVSYATSGMIFGAQLFNAVNNGSMILDETTKNDFNHFVRQCIVPDILINHKYTFEQLEDSQNILSFLSQQSMSPLRGIYIAGKFTTCADSLPIVSQEIQNNVNSQTSWVGNFLFGDKTITGSDLFSKIQNVYSYMMGMTDSATDILYQNTMINAIRSGIGTQIAKNDSAAAMINYGYTSAMQKQLLADNTLARVASYMIPLSQTVFVLVMIGIFPVIALLALQPLLFSRMLKMYINSLVYISIWPILFTIINFIMTTELSFHMSSISQLGSDSQNGITLSNQNQLLYISEQFAAYCGYLIALVPILAGFIFKGLDGVFMNAAQTLMGNMQGWTSQTATALADGNVSLANTSIGNHSWNNWSANKHDTNFTNMSGMQTNQLQNGGTVTHTPLNSDIYNTSGATSQLATSIHVGDMITSQISKSLDHSQQVALSEGQNYTHSLNQSWNDIASFSNTHGLTATKGHNYSVSEQTSATQAISNIMGVVHDVAERNNWSEQQAYQHLTGGNAGLSVHASAGTPKWGIANVGGGVSAGITSSHTNSYGSSHDEGSSFNISSNEQKQFSENYNLIKNASSTDHVDHSQSQNLSGLSQISSDLRSSDSIASHLSNTLTDTNRYSEMKSYAESNSGNIQNNSAQMFSEYVEKNDPSEARQILGDSADAATTAKRQALAESFVKNNYMNQLEKQFDGNNQNIDQRYQSNNSEISNRTDQVITNFIEQKSGIISHGGKNGIYSDLNRNNIGEKVNDSILSTKQEVLHDSKNINELNQNLKSSFNQSKSIEREKIKDGKSLWQDDPFDKY